MFRIFSKSIPPKEVVVSIFGHENPGFGDQEIINKSISLFVDYIPSEQDFQYSLYHIFAYTRNEPTVRQYLDESGHKFSAIISFDNDIEDRYDNMLRLPSEPNDAETLKKLKDELIEIIQSNDIPDNIFWSQQMEDKWIYENLVLPEKGFFLDIGACYPKIISNTYFFEKNLGWNGLAIEPDPSYFALLKKERTCILENIAISPVAKKAWYKPMTGIVEIKEDDSMEIDCTRLDYLLNKHNVKEIDLVSIDIEGYEEMAWSTFDYKQYNPKVIITEHTEFGKYDPTFTNNILKDTNYYIAYNTPLNFILVHRDVKRKK